MRGVREEDQGAGQPHAARSHTGEREEVQMFLLWEGFRVPTKVRTARGDPQ